MRGITDTVKHLLILNTLMFIGTYALQNQDLFYSLFALFYPKNELFQPWQIITHMFMHGDFNHLLFNMLMLWVLGVSIERAFGKARFIFFYISCGIGAVLLTFLVHYIQIIPLLNEVATLGYPTELIDKIINLDIASDGLYQGQILGRKMEPLIIEYGQDITKINQDTFGALFELNVKSDGGMLGASGAIMGLLAAFGLMYPNRVVMLLFPPIPIKVKYLVVGLIGSDLIAAFLTGTPLLGTSNTAYVAHIGGALTGFLMMYFWKKNQFDKYRWN